MREIEILVEVYDEIEKVKKAFEKFDYVGIKGTIDEYYYDPKRNDLKPDKDNKLYNCLRIRSKNGTYTITYKNDIFDGDKWLYSNEYETEISSIDTMKDIVGKLGLVKFIEINNKKHTYYFDKYEIVLEEVKDLGLFMEVEYVNSDDRDPIIIKKDIQEFIDSLGLNVSSELNMGKPELYLRRHNIKVLDE